jgi:hypothetical protein
VALLQLRWTAQQQHTQESCIHNWQPAGNQLLLLHMRLLLFQTGLEDQCRRLAAALQQQLLLRLVVM